MNQRVLALADIGRAQSIFEMYRLAIGWLCRQGIEQWDERYPALDDIVEDIRSGSMYVLWDGYPMAAVTLNSDQDPAYAGIPWQHTEGSVAVVHRLCVHPNAQGKGIGKDVMLQAEDILRRKGYRIVRLDAFAKNAASNALYRLLGYEHAGEITLRKGSFFVYEKKL